MTAKVRIALVVARAENGIIGKDGAMPWRMASDLKWFKSITMGKPVIMGRKTFQSIGKPLPGRTNIVVTRQGDFEAEGAVIVHDLDRALRVATLDAQERAQDEICVIGGGEIYGALLSQAGRIYLTTIEAEIDGDTLLPDLDPGDWQITEAARIVPSDKDQYPARIEVWARSLEG